MEKKTLEPLKEPEPLNHQIDTKIFKSISRNLDFFILEIEDFSTALAKNSETLENSSPILDV